MSFKRLYIWVEGPDDERFFNRIIKPIFLKEYDVVETRTYAHLKKEKIQNFLKSIISMDADYIYVADINNSPCILSKKAKIQKKVRNINEARINIVIKEIESWYLAGLGDKESESFKILTFKTTDSIIKEQFNSIIPKQFDSRIDFMLEILNNFSIETAKRKNKSFYHFVKKYALQLPKPSRALEL